jgi:hypothetical protein
VIYDVHFQIHQKFYRRIVQRANLLVFLGELRLHA